MSEAVGTISKRMNLITSCRRLVGRLKLGRAQKLVVAVVGGSVVLVGIAMIVLPGPAILVIPLGLAILATEFLWARRWLKRARAMLPNGKKPSAGFSWPTALLIPHRYYLLILASCETQSPARRGRAGPHGTEAEIRVAAAAFPAGQTLGSCFSARV